MVVDLKSVETSSPSSPVFIARLGETVETLETMVSLLLERSDKPTESGTIKAPFNEGASFIFGAGKKRAPSETFLKTLHYLSIKEVVLSRVCA